MGMSSSQPQPVTQGTMGGGMGPSINNMGSPTKNYGPVGGMLNSAQNQVNPQPSPTSTMNNLMGSLPGQNTAPQQPQIQTQTVPPSSNSLQPNVQWGMTSQVPTDNTAWEPQVGQPPRSMGNPGFMPMGNAGFMPMGNHNFMPMGFGQMPTFGGPRGGKAPQGGGNSNGAFGRDGRWMNY